MSRQLSGLVQPALWWRYNWPVSRAMHHFAFQRGEVDIWDIDMTDEKDEKSDASQTPILGLIVKMLIARCKIGKTRHLQDLHTHWSTKQSYHDTDRIGTGAFATHMASGTY